MSKNQNEQKQVEPCVGTFKPIAVAPVLQPPSPAAVPSRGWQTKPAGTAESAPRRCLTGGAECGRMFRLRTVFLYWPFAVLLLLEAMVFYEKNSSS